MVKRRDLKTDLELKMSFKSLQSVLLTIIYQEFLGMDSFTLTIFYKWVPVVFVRFLKKKNQRGITVDHAINYGVWSISHILDDFFFIGLVNSMNYENDLTNFLFLSKKDQNSYPNGQDSNSDHNYKKKTMK